MLKTGKYSKIVFNINTSYIFEDRGRDFTNWLESLSVHLGTKNILRCSCLVIELATTLYSEEEILFQINSFIKNSEGRISE